MPRPYRVQIVKAPKDPKKPLKKRQWHIVIRSGNGKIVVVGEAKPRKEHTVETAFSMLQQMVTKNFVVEKWDDHQKRLNVVVKVKDKMFG